MEKSFYLIDSDSDDSIIILDNEKVEIEDRKKNTELKRDLSFDTKTNDSFEPKKLKNSNEIKQTIMESLCISKPSRSKVYSNKVGENTFVNTIIITSFLSGALHFLQLTFASVSLDAFACLLGLGCSGSLLLSSSSSSTIISSDTTQSDGCFWFYFNIILSLISRVHKNAFMRLSLVFHYGTK
ncbi:hypothetical protein BpHYR1_049216 [Brachionus plicatilis]|uniref:Uncharacterized protein n=1 Tax=Brachionus plicatilis TaxID=10195 RepID=A0A3M7RWX7_BRAPC|nr:hypothetical protein BpHYR1_049216 [Brachionus plicatilis]